MQIAGNGTQAPRQHQDNGHVNNRLVTFDEQASPNLRIYVDGIERGSGTADVPAILDTTLLLGRKGSAGAPRYFEGKLDEIRLYNIALSAAEVAVLATASSSSSAMAARWPSWMAWSGPRIPKSVATTDRIPLASRLSAD